jgi:hypothetical protein
MALLTFLGKGSLKVLLIAKYCLRAVANAPAVVADSAQAMKALGSSEFAPATNWNKNSINF